jgi:hypothetical protein
MQVEGDGKQPSADDLFPTTVREPDGAHGIAPAKNEEAGGIKVLGRKKWLCNAAASARPKFRSPSIVHLAPLRGESQLEMVP